MIPTRLELTNFLAYTDPGPLVLDGIHVACLTGPNGAGKSSILDAITWVLWGRARTSSPDDLIHQGKDFMQVSLTFELGTISYKVIRKRKAGKRGSSLLELQGWSEENQSWKRLSESTMRKTQEKIVSLLRLDYDTFINSSFLVQGKADEFTTKPPMQRKQILANILGLEQWEMYESRAKDKAGDLRASLSRLDHRLEEISGELKNRSRYQEDLKTYENQAVDAVKKLEAVETLWKEADLARQEQVSLQREAANLETLLATLDREIVQLRKDQQEAQAAADTSTLHARKQDLQKQLSEIAAVSKEREELFQRREKLRVETASLKGANEAMIKESEPITVRKETLEAADQPLCPTCGQALSAEHRHQLVDEIECDLEARRERYRRNRAELQTLEKELEGLDQQIRTMDQTLGIHPALEKRAGEIEAALQHAADSSRRLEALELHLEQKQKQQLVYEGDRRERQERLQQLEQALQKADLNQKELDRLRYDKRMADEQVGAARQRLDALESLASHQKELQKEREQQVKDLGDYDQLRVAFSKQGVPAMIIETVVPELERVANDLLTRMTEGRLNVRIETQREIKTGELREALDIIISDDLGSRPYELYSGGEAFRINFAIRIGLSRLLARRAGAQLRSLFIDEGFGTQDQQGREHLIEAINSIQDDYDRILVITHIEELKNAFPTRIEVQRTADGSVFSLV
ncbi:MAG: SMC family ATPase [Anaerolineales bacterium]|nr:SMC family ATPase [Anaerolineales bacterium]